MFNQLNVKAFNKNPFVTKNTPEKNLKKVCGSDVVPEEVKKKKKKSLFVLPAAVFEIRPNILKNISGV